jgi:hypothetical protein
MHIRPLAPKAFHEFIEWLEKQKDPFALPSWGQQWMKYYEENIIDKHLRESGGIAHVTEVQRAFDADEAWSEFARRHGIDFSGTDCAKALEVAH